MQWQITNSGFYLLGRDIKTWFTVDCNHNCLVFKLFRLVTEALLAVHHGRSNENIWCGQGSHFCICLKCRFKKAVFPFQVG